MSAYGVLSNVDRTLFDVYPVGITKEGKWFLYTGPLDLIKDGTWKDLTGELSEILIDPAPGEAALVTADGDKVEKRIPIDVVFPVLHGMYGEDGTVQGLFEVAGVPFVGPDHTSSGVCMDKSFTKCIINEAGCAKQAKAVVLTNKEYIGSRTDALRKISELGYPVFVKPARAGSSVGVSKVDSETGIETALESAFSEDGKVLVEELIDGREIEVAVMECEGNVVASEPGEIDPGFEFYDYDTKYKTDTASYYVPARLDAKVAEEVKNTAVRIFEALGCRTLSRVDFFVKDDGTVIFNEINTIPGFTPISMYPKLFMNSGMSYSEIITALVDSALKK